MSESEMVTAVHGVTKLVQSIPRRYLTAFPDFRELNDAEITERQRGRERKLLGEHITPAPKHKADEDQIEEPLTEVQAAEAPATEGGN
jgi:hypothetical protein